MVLVAVITGLRPHVVAGAAQAAPVQSPPAVGDCVLDPLPGPPLGDITVTADSGGAVPVYPAQQIQPCTAARYGEVVAVIAAPRHTMIDATGRYLDDPNLNSCDLLAPQYVGITTQPTVRFWQPYLQITTALSRPSLRQEAAGQHWAACIVTLQPPRPASTPTAHAPTAPRYGGSIRDALHTGSERDQLGNCVPDLGWNGDRVIIGGCRQPHVLEILAYGDSGDHPVARVHIEATCQQAVRQLTAIPDPTAAGALSIKITVQDGSGAAITTPQVPAHSYLACAIATTGHRKLRGSLLALGRHPIPWA